MSDSTQYSYASIYRAETLIMSRSFPSPLFERANVLGYVQSARQKRDRPYIIDPGSGRAIDINTPIREIPPMRVAALNRAATRYLSNSKFRENDVSTHRGVVRSLCGATVSSIEL